MWVRYRAAATTLKKELLVVIRDGSITISWGQPRTERYQFGAASSKAESSFLLKSSMMLTSSSDISGASA